MINEKKNENKLKKTRIVKKVKELKVNEISPPRVLLPFPRTSKPVSSLHFLLFSRSSAYATRYQSSETLISRMFRHHLLNLNLCNYNIRDFSQKFHKLAIKNRIETHRALSNVAKMVDPICQKGREFLVPQINQVKS